MSKVGSSTGAPVSSATAVIEPEVKAQKSQESSSASQANSSSTLKAGANAADKKSEHSILGSQIAADLGKKVNPNAPPLDYIENGGAVAQKGQSGSSVTEIQKALNREGFKVDENGKFDAQTEAAVKAYQKKIDVPDDGRVGTETLAKLIPSPKPLDAYLTNGNVDPGVRKEIIDRYKNLPGEQRERLVDVATGKGFEKLAPAQQREMLSILDKAPKDKALVSDLNKLSESESFRKLDPSIQSQSLETLGKHIGDKAARETLVKLQTSEGFQQLSVKKQERILTMVGGNNNLISKPARESLDNLMKNWSSDKNVQSDRLKEFLNDQKWKDWETPKDAWTGRTTGPDSVNGPESVKDGPFRLSKEAADKYTVKYGSKEIPVYVPAGTPRADVDKLIETMGALPKANRSLIKEVIMESKDDAESPRRFDAGGGTVRAYPEGMALEPKDRRMSGMVHESAHLIDAHLQEKLGPQWKDDYFNAMAKDKLVASQYGKKDQGEDFAEVYLLYKLSKGKPEFSEYQKMFPERFKLIEGIERQADAGTL